MNKRLLAGALACASTGLPAFAEDREPQFTQAGELERPADYRRWESIGGGLGMTYGPARPEPGQPPHFTNVFVNPEAYRTFTETGIWPDGTFLILEVRSSESHVSITTGGSVQGPVVFLEASVRDGRRFPDGWAYFAFEGVRDFAAPLPRTASCYSCHAEHGAVQSTFTQFYPELFEVASRLGTVRDDYDADRPIE